MWKIHGELILMKIKNLKQHYKIIEKEFKKTKHQVKIVSHYSDSKIRGRCMEDLKDDCKAFFNYIDKYRSVMLKDLARKNCYNFLSVLYEDVDYDNSINDYCDFIQSSNRRDCDYSYDTLEDKFVACKTIVTSYLNIKKVCKVDLKLYNMQLELLELMKSLD